MIKCVLTSDFYHTRGKLRGLKDRTKGDKGDLLHVISSHDNVLIVENTRTQTRFSISKDRVDFNIKNYGY
jgi:hypothetical protein